MADDASSPVFAHRYRFQKVSTEWDRGRSGYTHLVFDTKKERLGVIKRAELSSQKALDGLKNEISALLDLRGSGIPEVYDTGEAEYGSKNYFYLVMEYIDGARVENSLTSLTAVERAEILTQLFALLAKAHRMGITNGDIDLKHLFWQADRKQLIIIDWGNAKSSINSKNKTEFTDDLAHSAEIVYSLITSKYHPSSSEAIVLPKNSDVMRGLGPIPKEFRQLCEWAPRNPIGRPSSAPYTAQKLSEISNQWLMRVRSNEQPRSTNHLKWILFGLICGILVITAAISTDVLARLRFYPSYFLKTSTPSIIASSTPPPFATATKKTPAITASSTVTVERLTSTPTLTSTLPVTLTLTAVPSPRVHNPILVFNNDENNPPQMNCWENSSNTDTMEGFSRRLSDNYWRFRLAKGRTPQESIETSFAKCIDGTQVNAIAANFWISRLDLERNLPDSQNVTEDGRQFGIFLENTKGERREYTIWIDKSKSMHLRIREDGQIISDDEVLVVSDNILRIDESSFRRFATFPLQIYLEINDQNGVDSLYLKEGPLQESVTVDALDFSQMQLFSELPSLGDFQSIGIIGYGGDTQILIWPLVFLGEE